MKQVRLDSNSIQVYLHQHCHRLIRSDSPDLYCRCFFDCAFISFLVQLVKKKSILVMWMWIEIFLFFSWRRVNHQLYNSDTVFVTKENQVKGNVYGFWLTLRFQGLKRKFTLWDLASHQDEIYFLHLV